MTYVVGFLFTPDLKRVVLIRKNKPDWQRGKLNGVGGKVEERENHHQALTREFDEETRLAVVDWSFFCKLVLPLEKGGDTVYFAASASELAELVESPTDEPVFLVDVESVEGGRIAVGLPSPSSMDNNATFERWKMAVAEPVYNLPWLVRMAIDCLRNGSAYEVEEAPKR